MQNMFYQNTLERNMKRAGIQKIQDIANFKEALEQQKYNHEYDKTHENVDWPNLKEGRVHKSCKRNFFKKTCMIKN